MTRPAVPSRCGAPRRFLARWGVLVAAVVALLWGTAAPAAAQRRPSRSQIAARLQVADSLRLDSLRLDSLRLDALRLTDSTRTADSLSAGDSLGVGAVRISVDSARKVDAEAVAAMADTSREVGIGSDKVSVRLEGKPIFDIYGGLGPYTATIRAKRLSDRLDALAHNNALDLDSLRIVDGLSLTTLRLGEAVIMTLTDNDAAVLALSRRGAATYYHDIIVKEVADLRKRSTGRSVLIHLGYAAGLFIVLLALLRGLTWLMGRSQTELLRLRETKIRPVVVRGVEVFSADRALAALVGLNRLTHLFLALLFVYLYLTTVFGFFPWTRSWSANLLSYLTVPILSIGRGVLRWLPNTIAIGVIVVVIRWLIKATNALFDRISTGEITFSGFYPEFADPTRKIVRFLLIILAVMLIYPYTPIVKSPVFQGLTVFLGILFSLGSSTAIGNMVAGVVLTYTRAFRIGDRIRVGDTTGDVIEKTFLITRVRTPKNEDVAIPNMTMISSQIVNYTTLARDGIGVVLHTTVTIGYDVPWPTTHRLLIEAAKRTDLVEPDPPPFVLQTSLGDFSVAYQLNVYTRSPSRMARIYSDLHQHIQDTFAEAGIEILSPVYEAGRDGNPSTVPSIARPGATNGATDGTLSALPQPG